MAGKSPSSSPERRILSPDEIGQRLALSQDILKTQTDLFELQKDIVQDNPTQRERLLKPLLRSHHALTLLEKQNLNQSHKKDISTLRGQFMTLIREIKPDFKLNITVEEGIPTELSVEKKPNNDNTLTFGLGLSPEQQAEAQELLSRIGPKVIPPKKEASKDATPLPTS